jgi:hypothetical protein
MIIYCHVRVPIICIT